MKLVFDCDEVIFDTSAAIRQCYLSEIDKNAKIPVGCYASMWDVWGPRGTAEAKNKWLDYMIHFTNSQYFKKIPPFSEASDVMRRMKKSGHDLYVLSAISADPLVSQLRKQNIEKAFGTDVFSDVICIGVLDSKKDVLKRLKATALVDDGVTNIGHALELGMTGIWKHCPENSQMMNAILFGKEAEIGYWKSNQRLVREKAIIARTWQDIERIITNLSLQTQRK